jgi:hypothetical protein
MNSLEIYKYLSGLCHGGRIYFDVLPCDGLDNLKIPYYPACLIINSDPASLPGEHWVSMYIENKKSLEFFCSYGVGLDFYRNNFKNFVKSYNVIQNFRALQSLGSIVCGQYAIYFLYKRLTGCCRMSLYCSFSQDTKKNDVHVKQFVKFSNHLLHSNCIYKRQIQCCTKF